MVINFAFLFPACPSVSFTNPFVSTLLLFFTLISDWPYFKIPSYSFNFFELLNLHKFNVFYPWHFPFFHFSISVYCNRVKIALLVFNVGSCGPAKTKCAICGGKFHCFIVLFFLA